MRDKEVRRLVRIAENYEKKNPHQLDSNGVIKDGLFVWMGRYRGKRGKKKLFGHNAVCIWIAQGEIITPDYDFALFVINKIKTEGWRFMEKENV